jgi:hypothetical protein
MSIIVTATIQTVCTKVAKSVGVQQLGNLKAVKSPRRPDGDGRESPNHPVLAG